MIFTLFSLPYRTVTNLRSEIVSYHFYLANGLHIFQALPFDFQALYLSGGHEVRVWEGFSGGPGGSFYPWGRQEKAMLENTSDTHPTTATRKSVFDA